MKYTYTLLLIAGLAINQDIYAQDYYKDALRFSQYDFGSSARLKALGNAQTAVGGDISSIGGNPAGLGLFTKSEFSLTTEVMRYSTESNYFGQSANASRGKVNINNLGAVFVVKLPKFQGQDAASGAISLNFGLGYNKTNDFGNKIQFSGTNTQNSIANFYADLANSYSGGLDAGSLEDAAFNGNLIDDPNGVYLPRTNSNRLQNEVIIRNGSQSEFNLSAGLNVGNKLYFGTSIGILGLNYSSDNTFNEKGKVSYSDNNGNYTENYNNDYYQRYETKGSGFNAKAGLIFRPNQYFRFGATVQSPNYYTIDDTYSESNAIQSTDNPYFLDQKVESENSEYPTAYQLQTPAKFSLGAAFFQSKIGFITAEVELVDYSSMKLKSADYDVTEDNRFIVNNYKNSTNYKLGAEIKASPSIMIRGGYALRGSAIENSTENLDIETYSFGGGYRWKNINLDIAYQTSSVNYQIRPYLLNSGIDPIANSRSTTNGIFITIGTRF